MNTELCELMRSIEKEGVLVPLLVRTKVLLAEAKMAEKIVNCPLCQGHFELV